MRTPNEINSLESLAYLIEQNKSSYKNIGLSLFPNDIDLDIKAINNNFSKSIIGNAITKIGSEDFNEHRDNLIEFFTSLEYIHENPEHKKDLFIKLVSDSIEENNPDLFEISFNKLKEIDPSVDKSMFLKEAIKKSRSISELQSDSPETQEKEKKIFKIIINILENIKVVSSEDAKLRLLWSYQWNNPEIHKKAFHHIKHFVDKLPPEDYSDKPGAKDAHNDKRITKYINEIKDIVRGDNIKLAKFDLDSYLESSISNKLSLENHLHVAYAVGNTDAIMILQGIMGYSNTDKNHFDQLPLQLFPPEQEDKKKSIVSFNVGLNGCKSPFKKLTHTFKSLGSDELKKELFSNFLKHKKLLIEKRFYPNGERFSRIETKELESFFSSFAEDKTALDELKRLCETDEVFSTSVKKIEQLKKALGGEVPTPEPKSLTTSVGFEALRKSPAAENIAETKPPNYPLHIEGVVGDKEADGLLLTSKLPRKKRDKKTDSSDSLSRDGAVSELGIFDSSSTPANLLQTDALDPVQTSQDIRSISDSISFEAVRTEGPDSAKTTINSPIRNDVATDTLAQYIQPEFTGTPLEIQAQSTNSSVSASDSKDLDAPPTQTPVSSAGDISVITVSKLAGARDPNSKSPSEQDYEKLSDMLTGKILVGSRSVQAYTAPQEDAYSLSYSPLNIFNVNFKDTHPAGNDGRSHDDHKLKNDFHAMFDPLVDKIYQSDISFNKRKLTTYLYAILAISTGEEESINSLYNYYDHLKGNSADDAVYEGIGHGSWIEKPEHYSKLKGIIKEMDKVYEAGLAKETLAFSEKNLKDWLDKQCHEKSVKEFKYSDNENFVKNLIDEFKGIQDSATYSSGIKSESEKLEENLKEFLQENTKFLIKLGNTIVAVDDENKALANHLMDDLFQKMSPKNSNQKDYYQSEKLTELRDDFQLKIQAFLEKLSDTRLPNYKLPEFDADDHLILELILKIPTNIDDILKIKLREKDPEKDRENQKKIKQFSKSFEVRQSITEFREICLNYSENYSEKARDIRESKQMQAGR